jgi:hypothetical protein
MLFSFVQERVHSAHKLHWTMWFSGEQVVCGVHLLGLQIHFSRIGSKLVGVYVQFSMSQNPFQFDLQSSAFSKIKERKKKKEKKRNKGKKIAGDFP